MSPNAQPTRVNRVSATSRTAVYGPVRTVVWEGRSREAPPYPDRWHFSDLLTPPTNVDYQGRSGSNSDIAKSTRCRYESLGWTCSGASSARPGGFNSAGWNHSA